MNPVKSWSLEKCFDIGVWDPETTTFLGHLAGPEHVSSHKSRTPAAIFTNRNSFSPQSWDESNENMKSQEISWPLGLGLRNYIWVTWAQKMYQAISPEPLLQFSQTGSHFSRTMRWYEFNKIMKSQKISWSWSLNYIRLAWAQKTYEAIYPEPLAAILTNRTSFCQESWDESKKSRKSSKNFLTLWSGV